MGKELELRLLEVMCNPVNIMSDSESLSPGMKIFMTEKEALWHKFEHGFSQQGSSSKGNPLQMFHVLGLYPNPKPDPMVE